MDQAIHTFHLLQILTEYSDQQHILSRSDICTILKQQYDETMAQNKFYKCIRDLTYMGVTISTYTDNGKGYYLCRSLLDKGSVFNLCHIIHSSPIPIKNREKIEKMFLSLLSRYEQKEYTEMVIIDNHQPDDEALWINNYSIISSAVAEKRYLEIVTMHCDQTLHYVPEKSKHTVIAVYQMNKGNLPYLAGYDPETDKILHFRIDRIYSVKVLEQRSSFSLNKLDAYDYSRSKVNMFAGKDRRIELLCKKSNHFLDHIKDELKNVESVKDYDSDYYQIVVHAPIRGIVIFAQKYIDAVRIISPQEAVDQLKQILREALDFYETSRIK